MADSSPSLKPYRKLYLLDRLNHSSMTCARLTLAFAMLSAGMRLGPYQILAPLGRGGMGEVYRAKDLRLGREVAIKVVREQLAQDSQLLARFEREAKAVAALAHPNILVLHDVGREEGISFAVTELLEGDTLRARLGASPLSWREAVEIVAAVAEGLAAAHAKGIIHRDLKPENLFITSDGRVKILDFGLARVEPPAREASETWSEQPADTKPGTVLGTVGYMSPEQVRGLVVDARSDLFALGCILYELVAGERPFRGPTPADTAVAILHAEPPPLAGLGVNVPPEIEDVIRHCLAKDAGQRLALARDLGAALRAILIRADTPSWAPSTIAYAAVAPRRRPGQRRPKNPLDSLAVLPLVNASADPELEYLSDGITESIISTLSQLPKLRVMARSSVFRFKGEGVDACAVGRELKVRAVFTGHVQQRGDRLIIRVELVDTADGAQLWGEQYNRPLADILAVEEEMAREIVRRLRLRLSEPQRRRLDKRPTTDTQAYQFYLRGRFYLNQLTEEAAHKAIECFRQALNEDPDFALAYSGLADTYCNMSDSYLPPREALPLAREAARKALALDPALAEALTSLALTQIYHDLDWEAAEKTLQRALELNPNYALAHNLYGGYLVLRGRAKEALGFLERAVQLDPLNVKMAVDLALPDAAARRHDVAIVKLQKVLVLDPKSLVLHVVLGWNYLHLGDYDEALAALQKARLEENAPDVISCVGAACARAGKRAEALQTVEELHALAKRRYVAPWCFAVIYAALEDREEALAWLQKAYDDRSTHLVLVNLEPNFDGLRSDPRFQAILRKLGVPATDTPGDRPIDSLAVLPLVNAGADPELEYLSDGISEGLINSLSRLPRLRVISWASVSRHKGKKIDARKVGRSLGVRATLTGRVITRGDSLTLSVELANVDDSRHLWGERYDRKTADLLAVQEEITNDIVEKLRLRLNRDEKQQLRKRQTDNVEAYQLYLKGRYYLNRRTEESMKKGIDLFQKAIDLDPTYALAYVGVADTYLNLGGWGQLSPHDAYPRAKAAAARALEIDDSLAEAHNTLAMAAKEYDWDFPRAEKAYRRALELNPNYAIAHLWYAECLAALGRHAEAIAEFKRALELDPLSLIINASLGRHGYHFARQYDQAIEQCKKTIDMDPNFWVAHHFLGGVYACAGRLSEAVAAFSRARELEPNLEALAGLGLTYGKLGQRAQAHQVLDELRDMAKRRYVSPMLFALVYIGLDEKDEAFAGLQKALAHHTQWLSEMGADPFFDSLRPDPRFQAILREVGLAAAQTTPR